jgi:hypothetical protein
VAHRQILTRLNFKTLPSELGIFMIGDSKLLRRYATILSTDACGLPFHRPNGLLSLDVEIANDSTIFLVIFVDQRTEIRGR